MKNLKVILIIFLAFALSFLTVETYGQVSPTDSIPPDPAQIAVYSIQNLRFGAFTQGAIGGTVIIAPTGTRTVSGDIIQLNLGVPYSESIFEVEGIVGTVVSIYNGPNAILIGSNGGSMSMILGSSSPASPFIISTLPPSRTEIRIGGTLNVGAPAANPPGTYTGTFYITFNQE